MVTYEKILKNEDVISLKTFTKQPNEKETIRFIQTSELKQMKNKLIDRIKRLEADLKEPLAQNNSEQAGQLTNRVLHTRLLKVEKENLKSISAELALRPKA